MYYKEALRRSNEMISQDNFAGMLTGFEESKRALVAKKIYMVVLPWLVEMLSELCEHTPTTAEKDAKYIYIFIFFFNCLKKLIVLYMNKFPARGKTLERMLQVIGAGAFILAWKALAMDESCENWNMMNTFEDFCAGACPKETLVQIERVMYALSRHSPCLKETRINMNIIRNVQFV
jgi:hypothetical protein